MKFLVIQLDAAAALIPNGSAVTVTNGTITAKGSVYGLADVVDPPAPAPVLVPHTHPAAIGPAQ